MESSPLDPTKDDLPLRSNTNHMLVRHYVLDLTVYFQRKVIGGSIVLFLEPVKVSSQNIISDSNPLSPSSKSAESNPEIPSGDPLVSEEFTLVLDCCDLEVSRVDEVDVTAALAQLNKNPQHPSSSLVERLISMSPSCWKRQHELYLQCSSSPSVQTSRPLRFHTDRWSLQISKSGVCSPQDFPCVLRVWYETKISGGSVRWTKDQDGRCCVYTMGSPINNRALFPCQEPPVAMSTWQAQVRSPCDYTVLMSGENEASPEPAEEGFCQWKYYVTMPMPASTFTIAVGQWLKVDNTEDQCVRNICLDSKSTEHQEKSSSTLNVCEREDDQQDVCSHVDYPCRFTTSVASKQTVIPHRVFAPPCHLKKAKEMVLPLLPLCLSAAHSILGVHPFSRLDVLIVPAGFSSLGMASPHMVFLSQSVLTGQRSLCGARLCHEIAHSWFGLVIGARDWTEEWISEGFATYLEDFFWTQVLQLGHREAEEQRCVKALLRWRRLSDEVKNSEEELQVLRPNKENTGEVSASGASIVKHALNPEKPFMQVHYLKGYFLLKFLAGQVGEENFLHFFKVFVRRFHGQLILSQDFLQMFLDTFPGVSSRGVSLESILTDWLDTPQLPKWLKSVSSEWLETPAVRGVKDEVGKWIHFSGTCGKGSKRKRTEPKVNFRKLNAEELVLLLEYLLDEAKLTLPTLKHLHTEYNLQEQDAEVKHRWCELVVKHKHTSAYPDLELFLVHHQAMGVYLYGELMVQEDARQQALARRCLDIVRDNMDQSARSVVEEMVL